MKKHHLEGAVFIIYHPSAFFKDFIYLLDREREREREITSKQRGRQAGREAGFLLSRARCGAGSQDPETMT